LYELRQHEDERLLEPRRHDLETDRQAITGLTGRHAAGRLTRVTRKAGAIQST
jgi:hypothetical protein